MLGRDDAAMRMKFAPFVVCILSVGCARMDVYYPSNGKEVVYDERGRVSRHHNRAVVLNGTDSLGNTVIDVTNGGVRIASAGGFDNSTSTKEGYRTVRYGIAAAAWTAGAAVVAGQAANAYGANQAASATSNAAASKASAAAAASKSAETIRLAEIAAAKEAAAAAAARAVPAAGSTIQSTIPSVVTPVVP
jgi:hypothetical protein